MKILILGSVLFITAVMLISCKKDNPIPPGEQPQINLSLEDVSCTEAWIKFQTSNLSLPINVKLQKDDNIYKSINLISTDTVLYIDSLLPNKTFNFTSIIYSSNHSIKSYITVSTLDTTCQDFTWQTFAFGGQAGTCSFSDVAVVNDECIYAVGEIYLLDSLGQPDPESYGFATWNGTDWKLVKLKTNCRLYFPDCGPDTILSSPGYSVFAFAPNDVWVAAGGVHHFDGSGWTEEAGFWGAGFAHKIWGSSDHQLWFVGNDGFIGHRDINGNWNKIESGTNDDIYDVWGITTNQKEIVYCVTDDINGINNNELITIQDNKVNVTVLNEEKITLTVWAPNKYLMYIGGGNGLFKLTNNNTEKINYNSYEYIGRIHGNAINDFFITGGFGLSANFNGTRWKVYDEISLFAGNYSSVSEKGNMVAFVGNNYEKGTIAIGRRE